MPTCTRTERIAATIAAFSALTIPLAACGADKSAGTLCRAWHSYATAHDVIDRTDTTAGVALDHGHTALRSLHELRTVANETELDAIDESTTALNALITALRHETAAESHDTWSTTLDTELQDDLDSHQQLADLMVDECSTSD